MTDWQIYLMFAFLLAQFSKTENHDFKWPWLNLVDKIASLLVLLGAGGLAIQAAILYGARQ